ncbi:MAG: hypothetical protein JWQ99_1453 [Blastococcus sp.]|nr:hypothetical protein [Blastococcus sp.]
MQTFVRWSGYALIAAGLLTLAVLAHPDIFAEGFAGPSLTWFWSVGHTAGLLLVALSLLGLAGLAALHGPRLGRLGALGLVLAVVGLVASAGLLAVEALAFPVLARAAPALLDIDGPLAGDATFRAVGAVALLWFVGEALVGVAVEHAGVLVRGTGWLLTVGALCFAAFEGPFVPVFGALSVVVFALAQGWLGAGVVRAAGQTDGTLSTSRSRRSAEMR